MEAFSLLRYWKSSSSVTAKLGEFRSSTPTIVDAVNDDDSNSVDDDGPFFDLEFAVPADVDGDGDGDGDGDEEEEREEERQKVEEREIDEEEVDNNLSFSPPLDELFFKGNAVRFDGSDSAPLAEMEQIISSATAAGSSGSLPASLAKSAARVRVFMLGLKRSKSESKQIPQEIRHSKNRSKLMTVRLKMEEMKVPKISLLTRATSNAVKTSETADEKLVTEGSENNENEKKVVQKYLKLVRPLYVKVSKRSGNETAEEMTVKTGKQRFNLKKHLGKSKSAVVHSLSRSSNGKTTSSNKIDDSLLQQQDGIQSAILHCKRSFNSSSSSQDEDETMSVLMRSTSDSSHEKFTTKANTMAEEHE